MYFLIKVLQLTVEIIKFSIYESEKSCQTTGIFCEKRV